jgi:type I restriction enzyme S subunit
MEVKPGYKRTEAGVIPKDWEVWRLKELIAIKGGVAFSSKYFSDTGPILLTPGNFKLDGGLYFNNRNTKRYCGPHTSSLVFEYGDLVVVMTDLTPDCDLLGKPAFIGIREPVLHNQRIGKIVPTGSRLSLAFLYRFFLSDAHAARMRETATGSTVRHTSNGSIYGSLIALPPTKAEQEAIAEALSDADAQIESLEQLIAKKRHLKQGVMQELLRPKDGWKETTVLDLANGKKELFDDGDWIEAEHITEDGVRFVQTGNIGIGQFVEKEEKKYIFEKSFLSLQCKEIKEGDLLICRLAEPAGRACILPDLSETKIVTSVDVTIFKPPLSAANRVFLVNLFSTDQWFRAVSDRSGGTTHKRISRGALGGIRISLPPIGEQTAIAAVLSDIGTEIAALERKLTKSRQLKQGMMQELLTGRMRLI